MMSSFLPFLILSCMLCKTVVAQVRVSADNSSPANGTTVKLTCNITNFALPSSWINDTSSGILSTCVATAGVCSVTTSGRYSYSVTASTIVVQITSYDASSDNFGWKCQHDNYTHVFKFTNSTTESPPSTNDNDTADCALKSFLGLALGVGLGNDAICIICLIVIVILILVKKEKLAVDINIGETLRQHGSDVKIICSVYGSENKSVYWTGQEENQLTKGGRYTIASYDSNTNESSLIIRTSSMTNAEGYICQVVFEESGVSLKIYITITVLDNGSLKVSIEKIMLFVPASGKERREWIGPQKNILPNTERYTIVPYDSNTNEGHITIKSFSMNDNGSYTCQPKNSSGTSPTYSIKISTNDAANPNKGAWKLILGLGFGIIGVACIVCIVILVMIGEPCALKFAIGLGLGLGIPFVGCIIVIVILVKKFLKPPPASKNGNVKSGSAVPV